MFDFIENMFYNLPMSEKSKIVESKVIELPDSPAGTHGLTTRQFKILEAIKKAVDTQGYPPTMRELCAASGLTSTASVSYQLESLEKKGFIRRDPTRGRAIEVLMPEDKSAENSISLDKTKYIPLVGRIAAGGPITAEQEIEETFPLPESIVGSGDLFMLRVVGESMIDAAICDGDYVVIRAQKDCNNGEIVAAMIDGEATVKTFSRKNGHIWLLPANDNFAPIDGDQCEILGKVTAVMRSLR
jgi:repressor LexA